MQRVDGFDQRVERGLRRGAARGARLGARGEQIGADLVVQFAPDLLALLVLDRNQPRPQLPVLALGGFERGPEHIEAGEQGGEFGRGLFGQPGGVFAPAERRQARGEPLQRRQGEAGDERDDRKSQRGRSRAVQRQRDKTVP